MNTRSLTLRVDEWLGTRCEHVVVQDVSSVEFDAWLDQMDAEKHTLLVLIPKGDGDVDVVAHFAVGGGKGQFVVYMTDDNESFWSLLSANSTSNQTALVCAGGQEGDYPLRRIVEREQARSAGHAYLALGKRDPTQRWERS